MIKYVLKNKQGLYLQSLSANRNDYSFTTDILSALSFRNKDDADKKRMALLKYKLIVVEA